MATWKKILTALPAMTDLGTGTPGSLFLKGDGSWATPSTGANDNYYLDGITKSSNTLTFSVSGATNQTYAFGSNAFNSTGFTTNTGTVTNVTITAPLVVANGTTTPALSMAAATNSVAGYLTAADHTTFASHTTNTGTVTSTGTMNADEFARFDSSGVLEALTVAETLTALNVADDADANRSISDSVSTTSSTVSASSTAAKAAYDRTWATVNNVDTTGSYAAGGAAGPVLTFDGSGTVTIPSAGASASGIVTTGTQSFGGAKTFASAIITGNITVGGNINVSGTSTITNTTVEVLALEDNTIKLNAGLSGGSEDAGLLVEMGSGSSNNPTLFYDVVQAAADTTTGRWVIGTSTTNVVTGTTYGADMMQVRIDGEYSSSSTKVPIGHMQYDAGSLYVRVED